MDLAIELQAIYDSEINLEIGSLWDGGIEVRLGDRMGGFLAEDTLSSTAEIVPWLQEAIAHLYPESTYAKGIDADLRSRAALRLFFPPRVGAQVICPRCGHRMPLPAWTRCSFSTVRVAGNLSRLSRRGCNDSSETGCRVVRGPRTEEAGGFTGMSPQCQ